MSIRRTMHCDGPDCEAHVGANQGKTPFGWLTVTSNTERHHSMHFCSWDCSMRYGAQFPPLEIIGMSSGGEQS